MAFEIIDAFSNASTVQRESDRIYWHCALYCRQQIF
jgi:hypothetical protein